jgi:hypothetical protein
LVVLSIPRDTSPEIQARLDAHYRGMTPAESVGRALALTEVSNRFGLSLLRQEFPEASDLELRLRLALRTLPKDLGVVLARRMGYPHFAHDIR